jgi:hypothetical protein
MSLPVVLGVSHSLNWMSMVRFVPAPGLAKERMRVFDRLRQFFPLTLCRIRRR